MNKNNNRLAKSIAFGITGIASLIVLIFLGNIVLSLSGIDVNNPSTIITALADSESDLGKKIQNWNLVYKLSKAFFIILGIILIGLGIYNLVMQGGEEKQPEKE